MKTERNQNPEIELEAIIANDTIFGIHRIPNGKREVVIVYRNYRYKNKAKHPLDLLGSYVISESVLCEALDLVRKSGESSDIFLANKEKMEIFANNAQNRFYFYPGKAT